MKPVKTPAQIAAVYGCTVEQAATLLRKNADVLRGMAERAERTGKKVNGYTAQELRHSAIKYEKAFESKTC